MISLKKPINITNIIEEIYSEYVNTDYPWIIGYSGGKDSSTVLKLVFQALKDLKTYHKPITLLYCDTGVEIPIVNNYVKSTLKQFECECKKHNIPIKIKIATPKLNNSYFVKIIGRGYPSPTNKFRWCTNRLRITPVKEVIENTYKNKKTVVLLGVRNGESTERTKTIANHKTDSKYLRQSSNNNALIYSPILNFSTSDIWEFLANETEPFSINGKSLNKLYQKASALKKQTDIYDLSYGDARFGCWACTVIRKDKAVTNLILDGHHELLPLLNFRNWLMTIRDDKKYRQNKRRNGQNGMGPFTLEARKIILEQLLKAQKESGLSLITNKEIKLIKELWEKDKGDYRS